MVTASNDLLAEVSGDGGPDLFSGWLAKAFNAPARTAQKVRNRPRACRAAGADSARAGMPGLTAYAGLVRISSGAQGQATWCSSPALPGAVRLGRLPDRQAPGRGHTVIGSAGGPDKGSKVPLRTIGVDSCDRLQGHVEPDQGRAGGRRALKASTSHFDNVGGEHLEAALTALLFLWPPCPVRRHLRLQRHRRRPRHPRPDAGHRQEPAARRLPRHPALRPDADLLQSELAGWIAEGRFQLTDTIDVGIETAPGAFLKLFSGGNLGKMLVKLG